jgi:cyanophycinase
MFELCIFTVIFIYSYLFILNQGSATSDAALKDPYDRYMTFAPSFLRIPFLETFITDTHFVTRDRMGRMLAFTARILKDQLFANGSPISIVRAIGIDEHTALLMEPTTGDAFIVGVGTAYTCSATHMPEVCEPKTPLTFSNLECMRLDAMKRDTYSFATISGSGVKYNNSISDGILSPDQYGPK